MDKPETQIAEAIKRLAANPHQPTAFGDLVEAALSAERPELAIATLQLAYLDKIGWCLNTLIPNNVKEAKEAK